MSNPKLLHTELQSMYIDANTKKKTQASNSDASHWVKDLYKVRDVCFTYCRKPKRMFRVVWLDQIVCNLVGNGKEP